VSVGHSHPHPQDKHYRELARIAKQEWFRRGLAIPKLLIRKSQIPWLGGSSIDLKHIYIDPRFAGNTTYLGRLVDVAIFVPAITEHESIEGILLVLGHDEAGKPYSYDAAHELATAAEERVAAKVTAKLGLRFNREAYQEIFKPFLKLTIKPPWIDLPADLNTTPYRDDDKALYGEIEQAIRKQQISSEVR
jgi:hypothetical protein